MILLNPEPVKYEARPTATTLEDEMTNHDEAIESAARDVHEAYLHAARANGWPIKPEVDVPFDELSKDEEG
jgi:hypothetical protein